MAIYSIRTIYLIDLKIVLVIVFKFKASGYRLCVQEKVQALEGAVQVGVSTWTLRPGSSTTGARHGCSSARRAFLLKTIPYRRAGAESDVAGFADLFRAEGGARVCGRKGAGSGL